MKQRFTTWVRWVAHRPIAIINVLGILIILIGGGGTFAYLLNKPIDVLQDWSIQTTDQGNNGELPSYMPGGTLEFVSQSTKVVSAEGTSTRVFDCDATASAQAREIQLSPIPANRAPGYNAPRENAIIVPAVNEFDGLPRTCRLVISVCYQDVVLWRDHCETAKTNDFLVQEEKFNPEQIRQQINDLNERIRQLEAQLLAVGDQPASNSPIASTPSPQSTASPPTITQNPTVPAAPSTPATPQDDRSALGRLPLIGGLLDGLGL